MISTHIAQLASARVFSVLVQATEGESTRGFHFPPINTLLRWKDITPGINKVVLISIAAALIGTVLFLIAANRDHKTAPKGARNLAEIAVEFIEKDIIMELMKQDPKMAGKPDEMIAKIAEGKLGAFFKEQTLTAQAFVKDGSKSVADYLKEAGNVTVTSFKRVALG